MCLVSHIQRDCLDCPIVGIIEGSEQSLGSGCLDRETYLNLSHRTQSTFANQRDVIYDIFLKYVEQKRRCGHYDAADRYVYRLQQYRL